MATIVEPPTIEPTATAVAEAGSVGQDMSASSESNGVSTSTVDSSWFHRGCKEVVPNLVPGKQKPQANAAVLDQRGLYKEETEDHKFSAVFIDPDQLWDSTPQTLPYYFLGGTAAQKKKVREAIVEWTWYANIEFEETTTVQDSVIRINFDPNDGSWSYVGQQCQRISATEPTMNLAWLDKYSSSPTSNERATILHEFGHALGLLHEHQSPAHGGHAVANIQAAIDLYTRTQGWSIQQIYDQVINVYAMSNVSNFSQVDTRSIMHYPQPKEITGLPEDIPFNSKLTDLDKAYMILQYPRKEMHPKAQAAGWSYEKALDVMGAPAEVKTRVLDLIKSDRDEYSGEISPLKIRARIQEWTRHAFAAGN